MRSYADIIIDISTESLDHTFQYLIPGELQGAVSLGSLVTVPFGRGNSIRTGYVVGITDEPSIDPSVVKSIIDIRDDNKYRPVAKLMQLAVWMKHYYGGTLIQSLKVVLPKKSAVRPVVKETVKLIAPFDVASSKLEEFTRKHHTARQRLLEALMRAESMDKRLITQKLGVTSSVIKAFEKDGLVRIDTESSYRNPLVIDRDDDGAGRLFGKKITEHTTDQKRVIESVLRRYDEKDLRPSLIHGVTGSGKTEVYIDIIDGVVQRGHQAIMLIPEIALTYQTVVRFTARFKDRVSFIHSKLSTGERYDQFLRAERGEIDVMIGPRSALFTPFPSLGIIVMDEEHETSYKSEQMPKYHARECAEKLAAISDAAFVMGSATPSVESYSRAKEGTYMLYEMPERITGGELPVVYTVDLRQELASGNKSMFSEKLMHLMADRLKRKEQIMLFLNRRGYASFVTCRKCGFVYKCPHCDVSLSLHKDGRLHCHYCGHEEEMKGVCPECGSKYIGGMRAGTEQVENMVHRAFPDARTIRMDLDTVKHKGDYEKVLSAFANEEADILIGTQMIVKGHDFPKVTLMGILAADMSLYAGDYRAAERTFELLTQAAGRTGRAGSPRRTGRAYGPGRTGRATTDHTSFGEVVIQTYSPDNYAVIAASRQDYKKFYEEEIGYRKIGGYPPSGHMLMITIEDKDEKRADRTASDIADLCRTFAEKTDLLMQIIGPADAQISKINDVYKKAVYAKCESHETLSLLKDAVEGDRADKQDFRSRVEYDFDP